MNNAIGDIRAYVKGVKLNEFLDNKMMQDAVIRNLEIIGESANRLTDNFVDANPDFPISQAVSMRNLLIHEYNIVNLYDIWDTIKKDLPILRKQLMKAVKKEKDVV